MSSALVIDRHPRQAVLWGIARWSAFLSVPVLLVLLVVAPQPTLTILWYVIVPVLPASFFLTPALWRGICPLATLNEWGNRVGRPAALPTATARALGVGGLVLFYLMVPARHLLFNLDGVVLAATIAAVGVLALLLGALYETRSAFCNALCPVLPVEQLYGQAPLLKVARGRCDTCTVCTPRGCLDLSEQKALPQAIGPARRTNEWLLTPLGAFAAALPGFVLGYNLVADGPLGTAPRVYGVILGAALASWLLCAGGVRAFGIRMGTALVGLAAAAGGVYYWYAGPSVATHLGAGAGLSWAVRVAGLAIVAVWAPQALRKAA